MVKICKIFRIGEKIAHVFHKSICLLCYDECARCFMYEFHILYMCSYECIEFQSLFVMQLQLSMWCTVGNTGIMYKAYDTRVSQSCK